MKRWFPFLALLIVTACASSETLEMYPSSRIKHPLSTSKNIGIQVPMDGRFDDLVYDGTGEKAANVFKRELEKRKIRSELLKCASDEDCLSAIADRPIEFLILLELLHWEERRTAISGLVDRVTLKVTVMDRTSGHKMHSAYLQGVGTRSLGGKSAETMMSELVQAYIQKLY